MKRLGPILGSVELQVTAAVVFLVLFTWPLWTSDRPSRTLLFINAVWVVLILVTGSVALFGREPDAPVSADEDSDAAGAGAPSDRRSQDA